MMRVWSAVMLAQAGGLTERQATIAVATQRVGARGPIEAERRKILRMITTFRDMHPGIA